MDNSFDKSLEKALRTAAHLSPLSWSKFNQHVIFPIYQWDRFNDKYHLKILPTSGWNFYLMCITFVTWPRFWRRIFAVSTVKADGNNPVWGMSLHLTLPTPTQTRFVRACETIQLWQFKRCRECHERDLPRRDHVLKSTDHLAYEHGASSWILTLLRVLCDASSRYFSYDRERV